MADARSHRVDCPLCGRRVIVRDDGVVAPHLIRRPSNSDQGPKIPRCQGGLYVPIGQVQEVSPAPLATPAPIPLDRGTDITPRSISAGLPTLGRRR